MGDNVFSSGMEVIAVLAVLAIALIVAIVFLLPALIEVFTEYFWVFAIGLIIMMFVFLGLLAIFVKNLEGMI